MYVFVDSRERGCEPVTINHGVPILHSNGGFWLYVKTLQNITHVLHAQYKKKKLMLTFSATDNHTNTSK